MARAVGRSLSISAKHSVEICNYIKKNNTQKAKKMLNAVIKLEDAVPFKRFTGDVGHRKGAKIAAGRYPVKACKEILRLIEAVEANAQFKGLSTANLVISHMCAQKGSRPWHPGRKRRRKMKRTNVELIVEERAVKGKKKEDAKIKTKTALGEKTPEQKEKPTPKVESKKEVKKVEKKEEKKTEAPKVEKKAEPQKKEPQQEKTAPPKKEQEKKEVKK